MPIKISAERVGQALSNIGAWRNRAQAQGAAHLFPLIALLESGAGEDGFAPKLFNETPHEFDFWNKFFRIEDGDKDKPYFNPITLRRAEAGFPHSNAATIRKNTFENRWKAGERTVTDQGEEWKLTDTYAETFRDKVLKKGSSIFRVPVLDVACLLFRRDQFDDDADARTLERLFRTRFPQRDQDYEKIFEFVDEPKEHIFVPVSMPQDYDALIKAVLVEDVKTAGAIPEAPPPPILMDLDDPILVQVQQLLTLGTSGIILTGPPGTGKSYYAKRIAAHLVGDVAKDVFRVQFHPSYGYEDFVEGYRPHEAATSGYKIVDKTFLLACKRAEAVLKDNGLVVLIVDEINRGDPARVFGELLTYIERNYRDTPFILPFSGEEFKIPNNLMMIGTMNPHDRSVAQVDAAFVRRFDHIELMPSREVVEQMLEDSGGFTADQIGEVGKWFDTVQKMVPFGLGHSFFADVKSVEHLKLIWQYRMKPVATLAIELNDGEINNLTASFDALIKRLEGTVGGGE